MKKEAQANQDLIISCKLFRGTTVFKQREKESTFIGISIQRDSDIQEPLLQNGR